MLKQIVSTVLGLTCISTLLASPRLDGVWFTCYPKIGGAYPFEVKEILREKGQHTITSEWGSYYVFVGTVTIEKNYVVTRGCTFYKDTTIDDCDDDAPPIVSKIKLSQYLFNLESANSKSTKSIALALRNSNSIKTNDWKSLAERCRAIALSKK
jgi:hypothetical protein